MLFVLKKSLATTLYLYSTLLGVVYILQRKLQYFPDKSVPPAISSLPHDFQAMRDISVVTDDGYTLQGWYLPASSSRTFSTTSSITVLHLHGNAGNRLHRLFWAREIQSRFGCAVVLFDYRGYGGNSGSISENGLIHDAKAAITWTCSQAKKTNHKVVLHLESIGSAVGLSAIACDPASHCIHGVVSEGGLSSCLDLAAKMFPFLPVRLLLKDTWTKTLKGAESLGKETQYLGLHGAKDQVVPVWSGRKLYERVSCAKTFVTFPYGNHNDLLLQPGYFEAIRTLYTSIQR